MADGQTLWLHDADLNQVTPAQAGRGAGLHAGGADRRGARPASAAQATSTWRRCRSKDGLQWVQATPKAKEGQLHSVKVGFRGNELAALEILDSFGQRSVLTFSKMELNAACRPMPSASSRRRARTC